ncbi:MAG: hypothetical protein JW882_18280 [Deltaproteobacteria bacterium]|nr:hypothetical protein [Deltaproteobacteria bacterium]
MERSEKVSARLACTLRYDFATRVFAVKRAPQATALRPHGAIFIHHGGPRAMNVLLKVALCQRQYMGFDNLCQQ